MRRPPELLHAYESSVRQLGKPNAHHIRAALHAVFIKRPSSSPEEVAEAKAECKAALLDFICSKPEESPGLAPGLPGPGPREVA
jgi:hypothetical protein